MGKLSGKVAVVTGGNSGIGLATAKLFHSEGAKVAIAGRDQKTLDAAVKEIGGDTLGVRADVARLEDIDKLYKAVKERFGKIDVLFANAGIAKFASIEESSEQVFDDQFSVNVKGLYFTIQKALPLLNEGAHHSEQLGSKFERNSTRQCLFRNQGGSAFVRSHADF